MSHRRLILASVALAALGLLAWQEAPRWTIAGSAVVGHAAEPPVGSFPLQLEPGAVIVIEGDSLVAGVAGEGVAWPELLGETLPQVEVVNRGAGGDTAAAGAARWQGAACADLAIILYGANDAAVRGWLGGKRAVGVEAYAGNLGAIIDRHRLCNADVLVLAPLPPGSRAMERRLAPYRSAAREVATAKGVHFVDPVEALTGVEAPLRHDGLHLRAEGREALAQFVGQALAVASAAN